QGAAAAGLIVAYLVVRIPRQPALHAFGQSVAMVVQVVLVDDQQRLVRRVWIRMMHAWLVAGRGFGDTPCPGGDGALGIAGALGAQRRQFPAQALGLKGGDSGLGLQRAAGQQQHGDWFEHGLLPGTGVPSCGTAWRAVVLSRRDLGVVVVANDYQ